MDIGGNDKGGVKTNASDRIPEVMNDKGGLKREEDFRRSWFLVLLLFF